MAMVETLSTEDVLLIHEVLVRDFAASNDPISPPGLRDRGLLESAVGRQHVAYAGAIKYTTPYDNAATLTFGVCSNHAFHNGNKRTALVALLAHLDKNGLALMDTKQKDLYSMIIAVANHATGDLVSKPSKKGRWRKRYGLENSAPTTMRDSDAEVQALASWIESRAKKPRRGEKQITFRELGRILRRFGYELRIPAGGRGNHRDVVRVQAREVGFFRKRTEQEVKRVGSIGYRDEGTFVVTSDLKKIRKICRLREEDGVDSYAFYDSEALIDGFVNEYRGVLKRLATR